MKSSCLVFFLLSCESLVLNIPSLVLICDEYISQSFAQEGLISFVLVLESRCLQLANSDKYISGE